MSLATLLGTVASYVPPGATGTIFAYQLRTFAVVGMPKDQLIARKTTAYVIVFP